MKTTKLLAVTITLLSMPTLAQNIDLTNLYFNPVPIEMANDSILSNSGLSETDRESAERAVPRLQASIEELRIGIIPDEAELTTQLTRLGVVLQRLGRHEEALEAFAEASSLTAEINGDESEEQIPILEQSILSHLALTEISAVTEKEEFIYALKQENYAEDSPEMFTALSNLTDWYTSAYFKVNYLSEDRRQNIRSTNTQRPQRQIGIGGDGDGVSGSMAAIANGNIRDVSVNSLVDVRLRKTDDLYEGYQESYTSNTTLNIVVEIARRIARLAYHAKQEMDYERVSNINDPNYTGSREEAVRNSAQRRDESYDSGKGALQYVADLIADVEGVSAQQKTLTMLDLADWDLAYGRVESAREFYRVTYQLLLDDGFNVPSIDAALKPAIPAMIPRIAAFPATLQTSGFQGLTETPEYKGYIDVSFAIDELGNAIEINFIDASDENISDIENKLETFLQMTKFRPLLRGGELNVQPAMNLRYYYGY